MAEQPASQDHSPYDAANVQVSTDFEHLRQRPAMYIGSVDDRGLLNMMLELVNNSINQFLMGYCTRIEVELHPDGSCSVSDNGEGLPVEEGDARITALLTEFGAQGFDHRPYSTSSGLPGLGAKAVVGLSKRVTVEVHRNGLQWQKILTPWNRTIPLAEMGMTNRQGTKITFLPDPEIFDPPCRFDNSMVKLYLRDQALLNPGLEILFRDSRVSLNEEIYHYPHGMRDRVEQLVVYRQPVHEHICFLQTTVDQVGVDVAFQWVTSDAIDLVSFANCHETVDGGAHVHGLKMALCTALEKVLSEEYSPIDVMSGFVGAVAVMVPEPQFEAPTKSRLNSEEARVVVERSVSAAFHQFLMDHPHDREKIQEHILASRVRRIAREAKGLNQRDPKTGIWIE